jgi:hypothetical protein
MAAGSKQRRPTALQADCAGGEVPALRNCQSLIVGWITAPVEVAAGPANKAEATLTAATDSTIPIRLFISHVSLESD